MKCNFEKKKIQSIRSPYHHLIFMAVTRTTIYVLECGTQNPPKFYVGKCAPNRVMDRVEEHLNGLGSRFTQEYPPTALIKTFETDDPFDEDKQVLNLMREHGIDSVRGGTYSSLELATHHVDSLRLQLAHARGECFRCGQLGHAADTCPSLRQRSQRRPFPPIRRQQHQFSVPAQNSMVCFRCGRPGHWVSSCYARTHYTTGAVLTGGIDRRRRLQSYRRNADSSAGEDEGYSDNVSESESSS